MEYHFSVNCNGKLISLLQPKIMGILNLTPDSFSDGGKFSTEISALHHVEKMISEGADIIDIGAQSTRPNALKISAKEEMERLGKVIFTIKTKFPEILISLDTYYSEVVKFGFEQGIDFVNDISCGQYDNAMYETVADIGLPYIIMHSNSSYEIMHDKLIDEDIIIHLNRFFSEKISILKENGINDIIVDPGFGFGKTLAQNQKIIEDFQDIGFGRFPLLAGVSRKSFIYKPLGKLPNEIGVETQNIHLQLLKNGAKILRVHDVAETKNTLNLFLKNHQF